MIASSTDYNFISTCVTSNEYASTTLATSTEVCYNSTTAFFSVLGIVILWFLIVALFWKLVQV